MAVASARDETSLFLGLDLIVDCRADGCSTGGGEGGAVRLRERPYTYNLSDDRARAGQGDLHVTQTKSRHKVTTLDHAGCSLSTSHGSKRVRTA